MSEKETARGKRVTKRRGARSAAKHLLPRLALWAGVGVFVFSLCGGCDDDNGEAPGPAGFVYVINYETVIPVIRKYSAGNGELVNMYTPNGLCISAAIDRESGDLFVYSWSSLNRYDKDGRLIYQVWASTARHLGREYIAYNNKTEQIYFLNDLPPFLVPHSELLS
jgi:hypothetical protein